MDRASRASETETGKERKIKSAFLARRFRGRVDDWPNVGVPRLLNVESLLIFCERTIIMYSLKKSYERGKGEKVRG